MKSLTNCTSYEDLEDVIEERGWSSTEVASKCWHYHQNIGLAKTETTRRKRQQVYDWLCRYKQEHHTGNNPSEHKERMVGLLEQGCTVQEILEFNIQDGVKVSSSTLYKYKRELNKT